MLDLSEAEISRRLAEAIEQSGDEVAPEYPNLPEHFSRSPVPAAVLMPLFKREHDWNLLFIRRTVDQHEHSNQVAFPGGRADTMDANPEDTALREAEEEIGLLPEDVKILGRMRAFITVTHYQVTPIVGAIPWPYSFHLASKEVSRIFTIPLSWLADPANYQIRERALPQLTAKIPVVYFHPYDGEVLWGASARFTLALLEILNRS